MEIDTKANPILYSVGTHLAYRIAKQYYGNVHYVWCTTAFNALQQPPTSNPSKICKRLLEQITTGDRHTIEIKNNKVGILRGADAKFHSGVISKEEYDNIRSIVSVAEYEAFFPVLYIINSERVKDKCKEVAISDKASDTAVEYKIEELVEGEFEVLFFKEILGGLLNIVEGKVGD